MRDAHRMKEKFDVSLDNRQIVSLLIAGIVVMGAVFVLGVVVGKKLAGNAEAAAAPDLLSALDANAQVLQEAQKEPPLTFQDELTRKSAAAARSRSPPPSLPRPSPRPPARRRCRGPPRPSLPGRRCRPPLPRSPPPPPSRREAGDRLQLRGRGAGRAGRRQAPPGSRRREARCRRAPPGACSQARPARGGGGDRAHPHGDSGRWWAEGGHRPRHPAPHRGRARRRLHAPALRLPDPGGGRSLRWPVARPGLCPVYRRRRGGQQGHLVPRPHGQLPHQDAATRYLSDFKRETQLDAFVAGTN